MVIVVVSGFFDMIFELIKQLIHGGDQLEVHLNAFAYLRFNKALGDTVMVVFAGQLLFERRQILLGVGVDDMGHQLATAP